MSNKYDKFKQKWHNKLPLDFWYPCGLGRYTRFKILHPHTSNQSSVRGNDKKEESSRHGPEITVNPVAITFV